MDKEDALLEEFGDILEWLSNTSEKVNAKDVATMIVTTISMYFDIFRERNKMLNEVSQHAEMTLTTSMIFGLGSLTSKNEYIKGLKERIENAQKPN